MKENDRQVQMNGKYSKTVNLKSGLDLTLKIHLAV